MKKLTFLSLIVAGTLFGNSINFKDANPNFKRENLESNIILSYNSSVSKAKKSVVNIATKQSINIPHYQNDFFNDPFFRQFFGFDSFPEQKRESNSLGSGVIISSDGYIVTNNHVVENADEILVTLIDGSKEYEAKLIGNDPKTDIAIIKIDEKNLDAIEFADSSLILEGDVVFAIGNPFGVGGTITSGIISALNKDNIGINRYENFIQTDASINPGNSGGALVDSRGALVGINSAILSRGGGNNGVGFAIPSNMVKDIGTKLISDGKVERGYIGVMIADLSKEQSEIYKSNKGALIVSVESGLPADKAGLKRGDLVTKADNKTINSSNELKNLIGSLKPNQEIKLTYERGKKSYETTLKLANMDTKEIASKESSNTLDGLVLQNITPELKRNFRLKDDIKGVFVSEVKKDSKAFKAGFMSMDIILQVDDKEIDSIDEFNKAMSKKGKKLVWISRNKVPVGLVVE